MKKIVNIINFQWLILLILFIIVILLVVQNLKLRQDNLRSKHLEIINEKYKLEADLKKSFQYKSFPMEMNLNKFHFINEVKESKNYLIFIFDIASCGKCVAQELEVLRSFINTAKKKKICFLAIVGITDRNEESTILGLYRKNLLPFAFMTLKSDTIYQIFYLNEEKYLDTPIYFFTDSSFRIIDIFKSIAYKSEESSEWLKQTIG